MCHLLVSTGKSRKKQLLNPDHIGLCLQVKDRNHWKLRKFRLEQTFPYKKELTTEFSLKQSPEILKIIYVSRIKNFYQNPSVSQHNYLSFCRTQLSYKEEVTCITRCLKYPAFGAEVMPTQLWS